MKSTITLFLLQLLNIGNAQVVNFQLHHKNPCDNIERIDSSDYHLTDSAGNQFIDSTDNPPYTFILPHPGTYLIHISSKPDTDPILVKITSPGEYIYIHKEPKILYVRKEVIDPYFIYEDCGKPAEGYQEDFYPNGCIRIRGNFLKGRPKDSVVIFYPNGETKRRFLYFGKEVTIHYFDSLGHLEKVTQGPKSYMAPYLMSNYYKTEYYSDGKIKNNESTRHGLIKIESFYPNGQLRIKQGKSSRTEYFDNGKPSTIYTWKGEKDKEAPKDDRGMNFTILKKQFDSSGQLMIEIVYECWNSAPSPRLEIDRSDWIDSFEKFENGKQTIKIEGQETKVFLKNNKVDLN
jgi:hypothetical protein